MDGKNILKTNLDGKIEYETDCVDVSSFVKHDGSIAMTGNLDMGNKQITNHGANIQNTYDVVNLGFCYDKYQQKVSNSDLDMDQHRIKDLGPPVDNTDATTKSYVDSEMAKIPALDTSDCIKKDGSVAMTAEFDAGNQKIKNVSTSKANESDKATNVNFVVKEINDNNANITQQYKDWVAQSHLIGSHKENVFKYLYDTDESASEYNIRINGFEENFREPAHQNKKAYDITMTKDTDGSNDYRSGSFNICPLPIQCYLHNDIRILLA